MIDPSMQTGPRVEQGGPPGAPPAGGAGGATMPTPDAGAQATAMAQITVAVEILTQALAGVGAQNEIGIELLGVIQKLAKMAPAGSGSPGVEQTQLRNMMMQRQQQPPQMMQRMQAQGAA